MSEEQPIVIERDAPSVNLMQIETGSSGYGIIVVIPALMPEAEFDTIISRLTYVERRLRAVKQLPLSDGGPIPGDEDDDDDGTTTIETEG